MGTGNTDIQIRTMLDLKVNGFVGTPSFLMTIIKRAEEMGYNFRRDFALRRAWFTGEMLPPTLRGTLEEDYQITTAQAYAVTEPGGAIAYECRQKSGMHLMDDYIVEIVDPETGKQLGPGEVGEIVVTPIHNKVWGLIRFGTGDISSYTTDPCPCGRTSNRLVAILGRTGDAVKVRGMFIVARQAEQVFSSFGTISRFQIVVGRKAQRDEMTFRVELKDEAIDKEKLAEDLNKKFQSMCLVRADKIEFVEKGTIPEKHQIIVDERTWK
jgi:phenylacetate-CoA ligase